MAHRKSKQKNIRKKWVLVIVLFVGLFALFSFVYLQRFSSHNSPSGSLTKYTDDYTGLSLDLPSEWVHSDGTLPGIVNSLNSSFKDTVRIYESTPQSISYKNYSSWFENLSSTKNNDVFQDPAKEVFTKITSGNIKTGESFVLYVHEPSPMDQKTHPNTRWLEALVKKGETYYMVQLNGYDRNSQESFVSAVNGAELNPMENAISVDSTSWIAYKNSKLGIGISVPSRKWKFTIPCEDAPTPSPTCYPNAYALSFLSLTAPDNNGVDQYDVLTVEYFDDYSKCLKEHGRLTNDRDWTSLKTSTVNISGVSMEKNQGSLELKNKQYFAETLWGQSSRHCYVIDVNYLTKAQENILENMISTLQLP